jgi:hypothetical protein
MSSEFSIPEIGTDFGIILKNSLINRNMIVKMPRRSRGKDRIIGSFTPFLLFPLLG